MKKISSVLLCVLLFFNITTILSMTSLNVEGAIITVDDDGGADYTTIQAAINAANPGDSVIVSNGIYNEHLIVSNTVSISGEDKNSTIIDGGNVGNVVTIDSQYVDFNGFTVTDAGNSMGNAGITINSDNVIIRDVAINESIYGIYLNGSHCIIEDVISENNGNWGINIIGDYNQISNTTCDNTGTFGLFINNGDYNTVQDCTARNVHLGFQIMRGRGNIFSRCNAHDNDVGIRIHASVYDTIVSHCECVSNDRGMNLEMFVFDSEIRDNLFLNNRIGIEIPEYIVEPEYYVTNNNRIYHNIFIDNTNSSVDEYDNIWDNGYPDGGNFWSDYNGTDGNGDDIGDSPYSIAGGTNKDRYPLMYLNFQDDVPPSSVITPISSYWQTWPLGITAETDDSIGFVKYVELWYRFSPDNSTWGIWNCLNDTNQANGWWWYIPFSEGSGYYEFYTVAGDYSGNIEAPPTSAAAICAYDPLPPTSAAGQDRSCVGGDNFYFNGSGSFDNLGIRNYTWTFTYNYSEITLYDETPVFRFEIPGEYDITLTVIDFAGNSDTDPMTLTVLQNYSNLEIIIILPSLDADPYVLGEYEDILVTGHLVEDDYIGISGAEIEITIIETGYTTSATTGQAGAFSTYLPLPPDAGTYTIEFSADYVSTVRRTFDVTSTPVTGDWWIFLAIILGIMIPLIAVIIIVVWLMKSQKPGPPIAQYPEPLPHTEVSSTKVKGDSE